MIKRRNSCFIIAVMLMISYVELFAQENFAEKELNRISISLSSRMSYAYINHTFETDKIFPHKEIEAGLLANYAINQRFSINGGFSLGIKTRRETYFKQIAGGIIIVDEDYSSRPETQLFIESMDNSLDKKRVFIEIPIFASFNIAPKTTLAFGGFYRFYFGNGGNKTLVPDYLDDRSDYGLQARIKHKMGNRISVSLDHYRGIRNLDYKTFSISSQKISNGRANTASIGLGIHYTL